jgi:hypothetical protein
MLKPHALLATLALVLGLIVVPGVAAAKSPNGAVVIKGGACTLFDGTGALVAGEKFHAVTNRNGSKATCRAKGLANPTGKAVKFNFANTGAQCATPGGLTSRWHETVSASGRAKIVCHFRNP